MLLHSPILNQFRTLTSFPKNGSSNHFFTCSLYPYLLIYYYSHKDTFLLGKSIMMAKRTHNFNGFICFQRPSYEKVVLGMLFVCALMFMCVKKTHIASAWMDFIHIQYLSIYPSSVPSKYKHFSSMNSSLQVNPKKQNAS
jgi:hypothetical protein